MDHTPPPGDETAAFQALQARFATQFRDTFSDPLAAQTVVVLPSLSLDPDVLRKVSGFTHYEERMLSLLLLLRMPRVRVILVTSQPIASEIIDYYLQLLPGVPHDHARKRLHLLSCRDGSHVSLTEKVLARPRLMQRIIDAIPDRNAAHLTCFNVTAQERTLALRLGLPIYGCDPVHDAFGTKSGARKLFREAGLRIAEGFEDLRDGADIAEALTALKTRDPGLRRAVVKLNDGFSGEGNALFRYDGAPGGAELRPWVESRLDQLDFAARDMDWEAYAAKFADMGGIVEAFIEGDVKTTPSTQHRIDPAGRLELISSHDQVVDSQSGQIFLGCRFPAADGYRADIQQAGTRVGEILARAGVLGRFGVDFISVEGPDGWTNYAVEINLRKGGTTHPFQMLQYLTDGSFDPETGNYLTRAGQPCYYYASDNLESPDYRGLLPEDLIDIAVENGLHFHGAQQEGVVFHLIGALSEFGKVGVLCVARSRERAEALYDKTVCVLDAACQQDTSGA